MAHDLQSHYKAQAESACPERTLLERFRYSSTWDVGFLIQRVAIVPSTGGEQMNCEKAAWTEPCRYSVYSRSSVVLALVLMATALFSSVPAFAQGTTGTLRGQVLDPAGAVVPNAGVTVTNQETGVSVKVTTTSAGTYSLPSLIPGLYKISVDAKGFKSFVKKDVTVIANQDNVADAQVELGAATETIEVT